MPALLKTTQIQEPSSATVNLTLDTLGNASFAGMPYGASSFLRNRIINGDMRIDQRNAGASVTPASGAYTLDRWAVEMSQASKFTVQQNAGSVTPPTGFSNYLGITSTSAYTVGASEYFVIGQAVEGFNSADFAWGSASAQTVTLSFWVRSSLTGTFGGTLLSNLAGRNYVFSYTINAANTWEQKTVTITGDTSGTWLTNNGAGVYVRFCIGAGASVVGSAGSWSATVNRSVTGQTSVVGTNGATFYITGVQLEQGSVATPFERRLYGQELALCQRYYTKSYDIGDKPGTQVFNGEFLMQTFANNNLYYAVRYPVTMRTNPTLTFYPGYGAGASPTAGNFWNYGTSANVASATGRTGSTGYSIEKNTGSASVTMGWQHTADAEL